MRRTVICAVTTYIKTVDLFGKGCIYLLHFYLFITTEEMHFPRKEISENSPTVVRPLHGLSDHDAHFRDGPPLLDAAYIGHFYDQRFSYRRLSYFPFYGPISLCEFTFEPAFIRKRNERERHRVRCVNEGYARLREHLPHEFEDKRLSKVETLRAAIGYIKHLQSLLELKTGMDASPHKGNEQKQ